MLTFVAISQWVTTLTQRSTDGSDRRLQSRGGSSAGFAIAKRKVWVSRRSLTLLAEEIADLLIGKRVVPTKFEDHPATGVAQYRERPVDGHKPRNRPTGFGDYHVFSGQYLLEQTREVGLCFVDVDFHSIRLV